MAEAFFVPASSPAAKKRYLISSAVCADGGGDAENNPFAAPLDSDIAFICSIPLIAAKDNIAIGSAKDNFTITSPSVTFFTLLRRMQSSTKCKLRRQRISAGFTNICCDNFLTKVTPGRSYGSDVKARRERFAHFADFSTGCRGAAAEIGSYGPRRSERARRKVVAAAS